MISRNGFKNDHNDLLVFSENLAFESIELEIKISVHICINKKDTSIIIITITIQSYLAIHFIC